MKNVFEREKEEFGRRLSPPKKRKELCAKRERRERERERTTPTI